MQLVWSDQIVNLSNDNNSDDDDDDDDEVKVKLSHKVVSVDN
jgi:hypothetical protein